MTGGLVPYDFESAFSFRFALVKPEPWAAPRMSVARQHLFHSQLRAAAVDWAGVFGPMREVTQRDAAVERGTIPDLWLAVAADVQNHLASLIGHWTEFESEVVASLA